MKKLILFLLLGLIQLQLFAQVSFSSSNLPIVIINTENNAWIPDEPKVTADMGIIFNGAGERNFLTDVSNDYNGKIGIELRGSTSQSIFPKKGYGLETRDEAGENNNVELLGMPSENDWILHNPYSDKSLIRNALTYKIANSFMDWAPRTRFVELMINGEYQGVYVLMEKVKRDKNRIDIASLTPEDEDITGGYILKHDKFTGSNNDGFESNYAPQPGASQSTLFLYHYPKSNNITLDQKNYIQTYIRDFENLLQSPTYTDSLEGYRKYIDVNSFIDFMFMNEITRNVDGYRLSTFMYKEKGVDGKLQMGPVWDFNLAFGNADYCSGGNTTGWAFNFNNVCPNDNWIVHFWWKKLLGDPYFRKRVLERWNDLRANQLSDETINNCIDSMANELSEAQLRNFQKWNILNQYVWPNNFVGGNYNAEINYLKNWTEDRLGWIDNAIISLTTTSNNNPVDINLLVSPNPSLDDIHFEFNANKSKISQLLIYDMRGRLADEIVYRTENNGLNKITWSKFVPSGMYYYQFLLNGDMVNQGKIIRH